MKIYGIILLSSLLLAFSCQKKVSFDEERLMSELAYADSVRFTFIEAIPAENQSIWNDFRNSCNDRQYADALSIFLGEQSGFFINLPHSETRFRFFRNFVSELMFEYLDREAALRKYIGLLKMEYYAEVMTASMQDGEGPACMSEVLDELEDGIKALGYLTGNHL